MDKHKYAKAATYFQAALDIIPNHPVVISNLATAYYEAGNLAAAAQTVNEARQRGIKSGEIDNVSGLLELKRKQFTKALEYFYEATKKEPHVSEYHNHMGVALFKLQKYPHAYHEFKKALSLDENNKEAQLNLKDCEEFI